MFYTYNQNNSGGRFTVNKSVGQYVIIEADSPSQADDAAEVRAGIYFDGCDNGRDCNCCGDRWYRQYSEDGTKEPMIYDKTIEEFKKDPGLGLFRSEMVIHIYYQDGRHEKVAFDAGKAIDKKRAKERQEAKKLWGNYFSLSMGVRNKNPIRFYQHKNWEGEYTDTFYDKSGNLSIEKGLKFHNFGVLSFASENKKEVEQFMSGARKVMEIAKLAVMETPSELGAQGEGMKAVAKLFK